MLQFLFFILIVPIFFILFLTALPYYYSFTLNYDQHLKLQFLISVLFLKVNFYIKEEKKELLLQIFNYKKTFKLNNLAPEENKAAKFIQDKGKDFIKSKFENNKTDENKEKKETEKSKFKFPFQIIKRENINHIFAFLINLIKELKPDVFKLNLLFSFSDPYLNGIFLAYYYTFKQLTNYPDLKAEINWQEVMFKAESTIGGKIVPLKLVYILLNFIFSIKTLKIFWKIYKSN